MSILDLNIEKFKEVLLRRLEQACHQGRVAKDSSKEQIVLMDNKRVAIGNKNVWSSKNSAQNAINRYIVSGRNWNLNISTIWKNEVKGTWNAVVPSGLNDIALPIRQEWAEKHLRIMPLRDYMMFEYNRNKGK